VLAQDKFRVAGSVDLFCRSTVRRWPRGKAADLKNRVSATRYSLVILSASEESAVGGWLRPLVCGVCDFPQGLASVLILDSGRFDALGTRRSARSETVRRDGLRQPGTLIAFSLDISEQIG
jgi:hypothetical protein